MTFLVFGIPYDPHILRVGSELMKRGVDVRIVSSVPPGAGEVLSWTLGSETQAGTPRLALPPVGGGQTAPVAGRVSLAWMRNKAQIDHINTLEDQLTVLCIQERSAWLKGWIGLTGAHWINPLSQALEGEVKLVQLGQAARLGMKIPETIVSNSRAEVLAFLSKDSDYIIKPLNTSVVPSHNAELDYFAVMTSELTRDEVEASGEDEWVLAPVIVQEKIRKACELRVIQVGDEARAVRIDSPDAGQTDYRKTTRSNRHSWFDLPPELVTFGARYLEAFRLDMGVFDYALTPSGEFVFYECNPCGQWAWLEGDDDNGDHAISRFVAERFFELYLAVS